MPRKRDIPKQVEIAPGVFYSIEWRKRLKYAGEAWTDGRILIWDRMDLEETYETLAHEILHTLEYEYKIKIPHRLIYKLEKGLGFFLRRNTAWLKWRGSRE